MDNQGGKSSKTPNLDNYVVKDPEAFARNVAHMIEQAGKAAVRLGRATRKGAEARYAGRSCHRCGENALQGFRILAV